MSQSQNSREFPNHQDLEEIRLDENLQPPNSSLSNSKIHVKAITFTANTIKLSYQILPNNRVIQVLDKEKFLLADFMGLRYDDKQTALKYIVRILDKGILINNRRYNYLGQSNSHMKEKKCLLYQAEKHEIQQTLNSFGDWSKFNNVSKLAKRIGLLFSSGEKVLDLPPDKNEIIDDVERNDHCFTDGCGFVSIDILKIVAKKMSLSFRENRYYPSVIQIRYQGFKGILLLGTQLRGMVCHFRKSMSKFKYRGPNDFFVVGHSKPYTFGRLNMQTVMLISALGIPDDVFIKKQEQHFDRLESMFTDLSIAFEYLLTIDKVDLAGELIENGFTEKVVTCLRKSYNDEFGASQKFKKTSSGTNVQEKLRIVVRDSRIVYAASDPTGKLKENQCFFRPTIQNKPTTIVGPIFCVRNPCYHAGDVVVLNAVDVPECEEIIDVVLFSVNGDVPTAHRSAGGDLDGDKFFVCWDPDLMPRVTVESYSYPGVKEKTTRDIQRIDLIKGFANQSNAGTARCATLFEKWANAKGPRCEECVEINKLFSHAVDGSSVNIPDNLTKPPTVDDQIFENRIWNKLVTIAKEKRLTKLTGKDKHLDILNMDREELCTFLEEEGSEATDYEMLNFLIRWCRANGAEHFKEFLYYLDFSSFNTYEKIQATATVPRHLLYNALNMSRIIGPKQISYFKLGEENYHWKLFHSSYGVNESGIAFSSNLLSDLLKAIKSFHRVFVVIKLNHELTFGISLHSNGNFMPDFENDVENRIIVYGFDQSGMVMKKKSCLTGYKLFYSEGHFQLYLTNTGNTFIWLGVPKKLDNQTISLNELYVGPQISVAINKLDSKTASRSSRITKTMITESEIYIVSNRDGLLTRYQVANSEYKVEMEKIDIDADYNPPDPLNPKNDREKELLTLSPISNPTNDLEELMERMECWAQYGAYDKTIKACDMYLMNNNRISDIKDLVNFATRYPIIHGPLTSFVTSSRSSEFPSITLIQLIKTCMNAVKGPKDALVMERVVNLLNCPVALSMYQILDIVKHFVLDYPDLKMAKEYLEEIFFILEKKQDNPVSLTAVSYFMRQIRLLCIQTLEEFTEKKTSSKNRYQARKGKVASQKRYSLISKGSVSIKARPGDLLVLKRLNRKSVEPIPIIRAIVISTERGLNVDISWAPRDIEMATWKVKNIGNTIGFRQSMDAIKTLYPTEEEEITTLLTSLLEPQPFTTTNDAPLIQELNLSQRIAVNRAENGHLTLWQGPAGTGKTKSIFQLILRLLSRNSDLPILVTGATNAAVDNIAKLIVEHGNIKVIRIGDINSIMEELHEITLEARSDGTFKRMNTKKAQQSLQEAKVICATCVGSGASLLEKFEFDFVIVDEASQVSEPICLIPLSKKCERFALVGDHKQLRPFCLPQAEEAGYNISLFERMFNKSYPICLLNTQYRMHPKISEFPNIQFYENKLRDGVAAADRPLINGFAWPNSDVPVAFVQVSGKEESSHGSKYNQAEVDSVFNVVKAIANSVDPVDPEDIGIISLYAAQLEKMKTALGSDPSVRNIEVKTADGFQGREKQLILITCVRCNEIGNIGFLEDEHRFNVMLTRAKRGLIIFGDQTTLCSNKMWKDWFEWAKSNKILYKS